MGQYVAPFIKTPMFIFQWQFDLAQPIHDGIYSNPPSGAALAYAQQSAQNLTLSL
jgi:hypothetical protein